MFGKPTPLVTSREGKIETTISRPDNQHGYPPPPPPPPKRPAPSTEKK